jgi:hypothetical protein
MTEKLALEVAEAEFDRFVDCMDLDVDTSGMGEEDRESYGEQRDKIVSAIRGGSLVINDNGEPVFTPQRSKDQEPITFYEPTGASLMAMDRRKKSEDIAKMYAAMADMTKTTAKTFSGMKMGDLKVCLAITTLFLG